MKLSEITTLLKRKGFTKLTPEEALDGNRCAEPKTFFKYKGELHINCGDEGFAIIPKSRDIGLGLYEYSDNEGNMTGTYYPELFFPKLMQAISKYQLTKNITSCRPSKQSSQRSC